MLFVKILDLNKKKGYVTYTDVNAILSDVDENVDYVDFVETLQDKGVVLIDDDDASGEADVNLNKSFTNEEMGNSDSGAKPEQLSESYEGSVSEQEPTVREGRTRGKYGLNSRARSQLPQSYSHFI